MHTTGAETWHMAVDGAWEVRAHMMGAETWGTATDGARDGAKTWRAQRGGAWARVRGVDMGEMRAMEMCTLRGPGCAVCVAHARRPWTRAAAAHDPLSRDRGGATAGRRAEGGAADNTGDMAGCSTMDRGSAGASGTAWAIKGSGGST